MDISVLFAGRYDVTAADFNDGGVDVPVHRTSSHLCIPQHPPGHVEKQVLTHCLPVTLKNPVTYSKKFAHTWLDRATCINSTLNVHHLYVQPRIWSHFEKQVLTLTHCLEKFPHTWLDRVICINLTLYVSTAKNFTKNMFYIVTALKVLYWEGFCFIQQKYSTFNLFMHWTLKNCYPIEYTVGIWIPNLFSIQMAFEYPTTGIPDKWTPSGFCMYWSGIQMVGLVHRTLQIIRPFEYRTIWNCNFKKFCIQMVGIQIPNVGLGTCVYQCWKYK